MRHTELDCYQLTLQVATLLHPMMKAWPRDQKDLQDQLRRAITSVLLNTSEGCGRSSARDRKHFYTIARASAMECSAALDLALAFEIIPQSSRDSIHVSLTRITQMLYKLH